MTHLLKWASAIRSAEVDADRYLRAAKQLSKDLSQELEGDQKDDKMFELTLRISDLKDIEEIEEVARHLLSIPLPLPIFIDQVFRIGHHHSGQWSERRR